MSWYRYCLLLLCLLPALAWADEPLLQVQQKLRPEFQSLAGSRKVPGLSIALVVDGRARWVESFGYADRNLRRPLRNDSRHNLGDLSKIFVAALAARLAAAGKVDLAVPLTRYLPDLRIAGGDTAAVNLTRLLTHHAGLPANQLAGMYYEAGTAAGVASLPPQALYFAQPPGSVYAYSNIGLELAAQALAAAGAASYAQLLQDQVLTPLGLVQTGFAPREDDAQGHRKGKPIAPPVLAREQAALGLRGSIADLARLAEQLTAPVPQLDLSSLLQPYNRDSLLDLDYRNGLAFSLFADRRPQVGTLARLSSLYPGARGRIDIALDQRTAVIVLANGADAGDAVDETIDALLDAWLQAAHAIAPREAKAGLPVRAEWPAAARPDSAARYYSSAAGLVALTPDGDDFDVRVLGLRFSAERRDDGWFRLHLRLLGVPLDLGPLRRVLVAPAVVAQQRVLIVWAARRSYLIGSAWQPPPLPAAVQALAGSYRLLNPDSLTTELGIARLQLELDDGVLSASYPLDIPLLRTRVPLQPEGDDALRVPGIGSIVGERLRLERADGRTRLHYSGYVFERE
ncbi:CubicO group peptidase (beta-lactamase class C family) [Tahibacter aquaticus]|uniref:CubicO group peptidase (Beta-lactamase class C family) n=1 Tax=Tahibacter aquaticus TaxID=520092 RepID=A0A4R6Z6Q9_9GAMM|nr:serine hydrolase domain-containing protein [Tahibacter aquaticus]TDR47435.1 CubicO group peptidase (beta-lactamase class C family) [Tahibacter aquaticus]